MAVYGVSTDTEPSDFTDTFSKESGRSDNPRRPLGWQGSQWRRERNKKNFSRLPPAFLH